MVIAGVDEAGKGPCIGPLVVAGVSVQREKITELKDLGVKDSKLLSFRKREEIFDKIIEIADSYEIAVIHPEEIDKALNEEDNNLLLLEIAHMSKVLNAINPEHAFIDCPSSNIESFKSKLRQQISDEIKTTAEFKADQRYVVVAAASIIAKVTRDREIAQLKEKYKVEFGSGYPSDPRTSIFVEEYWNSEEYSPIFRKSWETWKKRQRAAAQSKLQGFGL